MLDAFFSGFIQTFTFHLFFLLLGIIIRFVVGILPGIGGTVTLALMLPFVFDMKPLDAFAFLIGMLAVTSTTGDITSILFGVPGNRYPLRLFWTAIRWQKTAKAARALGAALMSSLIGALIGAFVLAAVIPVVAPLVLTFKSPEFFALALLGITFVAALSGESKLKGMVAAGVGLVLSMVGLDPQSGMPRYALGMTKLWDGVGTATCDGRALCDSEIVDLWVRGDEYRRQAYWQTGRGGPRVRDTFTHWGVTVRCSLIGTRRYYSRFGRGCFPQWMAYGHAVQDASDKSRFGHGDVRGGLGAGSGKQFRIGWFIGADNRIRSSRYGCHGVAPGCLPDQRVGSWAVHVSKHLDLTFAFVWFIVISNLITVGLCFIFWNSSRELRTSEVSAGAGDTLAGFVGAYAESNSVFDMGIAAFSDSSV